MYTQLSDRRVVRTYGAVALWKSQPGASLLSPISLVASLQHAEFSPDGRRILAVNNADYPSYAFVWDTATRNLFTKLKHPATILHGSFSPDGRQIVTAGVDHAARLWDLETGKLLQKFPQESYVWRTSFCPDGKLVLTVTYDGRVQVWDAPSGHPLFEPVKLAERIGNAEFSPDGTRFAVAPLGKAIRVLDTKTGKDALPLLELENNASGGRLWGGRKAALRHRLRGETPRLGCPERAVAPRNAAEGLLSRPGYPSERAPSGDCLRWPAPR